MRYPLFFFFLFLTTNAVFSQTYKSITYDYERNRFGEFEALPAEKHFVISGQTPSNTDLVEVDIFDQKGKDRSPALASSVWKRGIGNKGNTFYLPVAYPLRAGKQYDLEFRYYRSLSTLEAKKLQELVVQQSLDFLQASIYCDGKDFELNTRSKRLIGELTQLVEKSLSEHRFKTQRSFQGFSPLLSQYLNSEGSGARAWCAAPDSLKANMESPEVALRRLLEAELDFVSSSGPYELQDYRYVDDYVTEEVKDNYFSLNAGFGGVYLGGNVQNLQYGSGPYFGMGFPLATSAIAPKFFRNMSISAGVFLRDFEGKNNQRITGPIIGRPYYLGVDYRVFRFIRFNAGAALLEEHTSVNNNTDKRLLVRPFIGLSARVNLSLSLDR